MNDIDVEKEKRRWQFWEVLKPFLAILNMRWWRFLGLPGAILSGKSVRPPRQELPPMVGLEMLAREGLKNETGFHTVDASVAELIMQVMAVIAARDGRISEEASGFIGQFLSRSLFAKLKETHRETLMKQFEESVQDGTNDDKINLKNHIYRIKSQLDPKYYIDLLEIFYRLAYLHGKDSAERQTVERLGEWLGLAAGDIRRADFAARHESEKQNSPEQ